METDTSQISEWFTARREEFVEFVELLVQTESPSYEPMSVRRVLRIVAEAVSAAGYQTRLLPGVRTAGSLYVAPPWRVRGRPAQIVLGHCDTVWPAGTLADMPVTVDGDIMRGPGVYDMKAGVALMVFALRALRELDIDTPVTPVALFTSDEETGSVESRKHIERFARACERAFVPEPSLGLSGRIKTRRKGTGHFDVYVTGKASHAGLAPEEGASAILELSHIIQRLFALNDPERGVTVNVGTVNGGVRSNVVAPESQAGIDVRVLTTEDAERVEAEIRRIEPVIAGTSIRIEGGVERLPMEATPRNVALWRLAQSLAKEMGLQLESGTAGGASDGNFTSRYTATLDGLGPVGDGAHAHREYIRIDATLERGALLTRLLAAPSIAGDRSPRP